MKYLKTFETISNSIFNVDVFKRSFGITPDELEDFFVEMVDDLDLNAKVMWDRSINAAIIKIDVPVEGRPRLHEWFSENIKPKLGRIKTQLKNNFGLDYSGYQLGLSSETNFHYKLIWYKSSDLPSGKRNESFGGFQLDKISKQEYYSILDNNPLVYIPESKVLKFKSKLSKEYKLGYGRGSVKDTVEFFRIEYETEIDYHITSKTFSIKKKSLVDDEPCYIMSYNYEEFTSFKAPQSHIETLPDQERIFFQKKSYYRFEESDFNQMCENPQILLDYLEKDIIKESLFSEIPDPEPMDVNEWDNEVTDAEEVPFNQKEKELFISLSDTISVNNKRNMPDIGKCYLYFQLLNGDLNPKLKEITPIRNISIYKNDDEFYYVGIWERGYDDDKLYRCDGYECWEKFLKEIFAGYRELTKQTKTNESIFNEVPDPEPMNIYEWDSEVTEDKEVDFNQKEKELFISLADTISPKHKIDALYIEDFQLSFSMVNGKDPIFPDVRFDNVVRSITSYKMDDEFYYVNVWEGDDIDGGTKSHQSYRCDGYACWEKFLKEIFAGYRKLIS